MDATAFRVGDRGILRRRSVLVGRLLTVGAGCAAALGNPGGPNGWASQ